MKIFCFSKGLFYLIIFLKFIAGIKTNNLTNSPNISVIPFKIFYPPIKLEGIKPFGAKDYYNNIHYSYSFLEIESGKEINQKLSLFYVLDDYFFHINDNYFKEEEINDLLCNYSSSLSTSYEVIDSKSIYISDNKRYIYSKDYFKIYSDIYLSNYDYVLLKFRHSLDNYKNISQACGKIGLLYASEKYYQSLSDTNFINQIHKNLKNVDISWTFLYNSKSNNENDYDGLFIIGIESLEKFNNKNELIPIYIKLTGYGGVIDWKFTLDEIYIGNHIYEINDEEIKVTSDVEGIEIPRNFYNTIKKLYFDKYFSEKKCESEIVVENIMVIYCYSDKFTEEDIRQFPEINFYKFKIGYNFTFTGKELFYKRENKYFFKIISNLKSFEKNFILGRIFLKKYQIIFNSDSKSMSFYKNNNNKMNIYGDNKIKKEGLFIKIASYFFVGIIFLCLGLFFGRKYCFIDKKRLANELEDDNYEYKSKNDEIKKGSKLIEMS